MIAIRPGSASISELSNLTYEMQKLLDVAGIPLKIILTVKSSQEAAIEIDSEQANPKDVAAAASLLGHLIREANSR